MLIQRCVRGGSRPGDEETTSNDVQKIVNDINSKYATSAAANAARALVSAHPTTASTVGGLGHHRHYTGTTTSSIESDPGLDVDADTSMFTSMGSNMDAAAAVNTITSPSVASSPAKWSSTVSPSSGTGDSAATRAAATKARSVMVVDYDEIGHHKGLSLYERMALWLVADVFLLTPIREGLNMMPLEYIYVRKDMSNAGAVVVSEFSTCSALLNGALKVNPFAPLEVADALEKALMLPQKDKDYRRQRDLPFISSHPSAQWTKQIINDLDQLRCSSNTNNNCSSSNSRSNNKNSNNSRHMHRFPVPMNYDVVIEQYEAAMR